MDPKNSPLRLDAAPFHIRAHPRPEWNDIGVWIGRSFDQCEAARGTVMFVPATGAERHEPAFALSRELAQVLADSLWVAGIHPTQSSGSVGQVEAMRAHIVDLRTQLDRLNGLIANIATSDYFRRWLSGEIPVRLADKPTG